MIHGCQAIALVRDQVWEGIVDAYLVGQDLVAILGDMTIRSFPTADLAFLSAIEVE